MDILTIAGILLGLSALIGGQILDGGSLESVLQPTAALIVFGGTIGAVFISSPLGTFVQAIKDLRKAFFTGAMRPASVITYIDGLAVYSKTNGLLALEQELDEVEYPFLKKGLQLVIDGMEPERIREILEIELEYSEEYSEASATVFESAGGYAPTIGILGAVLGLIHVMENLAEPDMLGAGIAVAFVATVYGVGSANLFWLPIAEKLKKRVREESIVKELIIEGLIGLSTGENPRSLKEKLQGFLKSPEKLFSDMG
ncbi:MAG: flagellar motor protein [Thermodesulfobacteriota bacterium]